MADPSGSWLVVDTATNVDAATIGTADGRLAARRGVGLVRVFGEIDLGTRAAFEAGLDRVLADDPSRIVLDCSAMAFCGAGGLAAIMHTVVRGAERGTDLAVVGFPAMLQRLCAQLWPGPQPVPYLRVEDAVLAAPSRRCRRHLADGGRMRAIPSVPHSRSVEPTPSA